MRADILGLVDPLMNCLLRPRIIRRIDDGRRIDGVQLRSLKGLSEETLRDLGFTSIPS